MQVLVGALAAAAAVLTCFIFSKDLVVFLEAPVAAQVRGSSMVVGALHTFLLPPAGRLATCPPLRSACAALLQGSASRRPSHCSVPAAPCARPGLPSGLRYAVLQGVRFLQLSPGEFFFTTLKVRAAHACCHKFAGQTLLLGSSAA